MTVILGRYVWLGTDNDKLSARVFLLWCVDMVSVGIEDSAKAQPLDPTAARGKKNGSGRLRTLNEIYFSVQLPVM